MSLQTAFSSFFIAVAAFSLTACGSTTIAEKQPQDKDAKPRVLENISYVEGEEDPKHMLDLYFPAGEHTKLPVLVWIHGGAWREGDKQPSPMMPFLSHGYAVAGINYRLAPDHKFPTQLHDCKAAIRWIRKHADEYGIDKDRVGIFGISAGGHLAALLAATNGNKAMEGNVGVTGETSEVQTIVDWCGLGNLQTQHKQAGESDQLDFDSPKAPFTQFLGGTAEEKPELAKAASPVTYLKPGFKVPALIMHAVKDPVVPFAQSQELYEAWKKTGAPAELTPVESDQHIFISVPTILTVIEFFDRHLGSQSKTATEAGASPKADSAAETDETARAKSVKTDRAGVSAEPAEK